MAEKRKSYLQIAREAKGLSREMVADMAPIDVSTLFRYEQNPQNVPPEAMNMLIDIIGDKYLGYLYLTANPVAMRFLPSGVKRCDLLHAMAQKRSALILYMKEIEELLNAAIDDVITEDEKIKWQEGKDKWIEVLRADIALSCADETEA